MNQKEMYLGGWATALLILVALCSLGNEPFLVGGFALAMAVLLAFSCGIRLMLLSSTKGEKGTDWKAFGSYAVGAAISTIIPLGLFLIAA